MTERRHIEDLTAEEIAVARRLARYKPSASYIQRRMLVGYDLACAILDKFEADGLVSPRRADGSRTVLAVVDGESARTSEDGK